MNMHYYIPAKGFCQWMIHSAIRRKEKETQEIQRKEGAELFSITAGQKDIVTTQPSASR